MWSRCRKSLSVLSKWIAWNLGDGSKIKLGEDPIMGMEDSYKFSVGLLDELHEKEIYYLHQIKDNSLNLLGGTCWKYANSLNLNSQFKEEWINFIKSLRLCGIALVNRQDSLLWSWNTKNGILSAKLAYEAITFEAKLI